jgi:hypothetical protein
MRLHIDNAHACSFIIYSSKLFSAGGERAKVPSGEPFLLPEIHFFAERRKKKTKSLPFCGKCVILQPINQ